MSKPRILVIAKTLPLHDRASGDFRLFQILRILSQKYSVDFLSTTHTFCDSVTGKLDFVARDSVFSRGRRELLDQKYIQDLEAVGVRTLNQAEPVPLTVRSSNTFNIRPYLAAQRYDLVWIEFYYLAQQYIECIRQLQPGAHVLCDSVDLHFRRLARQCNFLEAMPSGPNRRRRLAENRRHADAVREQEIAAYKKCDSVVLVSEDDRAELARHCPNLPLLLVPNVHRICELSSTAWEKRSGILFVGNFDHEPNISSALFLKHEVMPMLPAQIGCRIVGSNPPKAVRELNTENFCVTGYVPDTAPYLASSRISVAPILFGAGMNGKIGEAISAGVPVVTTSLGALGMGLEHGRHCLVADTAAAFASALLRLHEDKALWQEIRAGATDHLRGLCSHEVIGPALLAAVQKLLPPPLSAPGRRQAKPALTLPSPQFPKPAKRPLFSVLLLSHNAWPFSELCLRSLAFAEKKSPGLAEYILVDNASTDGTPENARKIANLRLFENERNLGFAAGNNLGIAMARGKYLVLLNNDTVVPPHWLERLLPYLERIPQLGLLGPCTNTESGQALPQAAYCSLEELFALNDRLFAEQEGCWEKVEKVSGLCLVASKKNLEALGGLDPDFGLGYFEDDDLCLRAADKGLTVAWAKDVFVHHFGSASFGPMSKARQRQIEEGMARFAFKWGKRGLDHIAKAHQETLLRTRRPRGFQII